MDKVVRGSMVVILLLASGSGCSRALVSPNGPTLPSCATPSPEIPLPPTLCAPQLPGQDPGMGLGECRLWVDHANYYAGRTARDLLLAVAAGSVLANTSLDQDFQDWYQQDVRNSGTDRAAGFWRPFGDGQITVPICLTAALVGAMCDDCPSGSTVGLFGRRATRAYLVGTPPMIFMQHVLGGSRPSEGRDGSYWDFFGDDNSVSGHAFMGAVPLITGAKMTEDPYLKGGFYFLSVLPAWSRVNDDGHYLSQALLGWWMAYLASGAVERTEYADGNLTVTPLMTAEMVGIGGIYRR